MADVVSLKCNGCGNIYRLGYDAVVVSAAGVLADFVAATCIGNPSAPDLVASVNWANLDENTKRDQGLEIARIAAAMKQHVAREWECRECGKVHLYTRSDTK
jgi:hypothetical protein